MKPTTALFLSPKSKDKAPDAEMVLFYHAEYYHKRVSFAPRQFDLCEIYLGLIPRRRLEPYHWVSRSTRPYAAHILVDVAEETPFPELVIALQMLLGVGYDLRGYDDDYAWAVYTDGTIDASIVGSPIYSHI